MLSNLSMLILFFFVPRGGCGILDTFIVLVEELLINFQDVVLLPS